MGSAGKSKKTGHKSKGATVNKRGVRKVFALRHIDQVWQDVRKEEGVVIGKIGPIGTTDKAEIDEDIPAMGKHYCIACARYFVSAQAHLAHQRTKDHKRRCKELDGPAPHSQADADWAAGMGAPDNGIAAAPQAMQA